MGSGEFLVLTLDDLPDRIYTFFEDILKQTLPRDLKAELVRTESEVLQRI